VAISTSRALTAWQLVIALVELSQRRILTMMMSHQRPDYVGGGGFKLIGQGETRLPTSLRPAVGTTNRPRKNREKHGKSAASESAPPADTPEALISV